jgi:anti-anti-sigma factor
MRDEPVSQIEVVEIDADAHFYAPGGPLERVRELIESRQKPFVVLVDLSEATFMVGAATPLSRLVGSWERLRAAGGSIAVICADQSVGRRVFEITRLDAVFPIYGSREEALAAIETGRARSPVSEDRAHPRPGSGSHPHSRKSPTS